MDLGPSEAAGCGWGNLEVEGFLVSSRSSQNQGQAWRLTCPPLKRLWAGVGSQRNGAPGLSLSPGHLRDRGWGEGSNRLLGGRGSGHGSELGDLDEQLASGRRSMGSCGPHLDTVGPLVPPLPGQAGATSHLPRFKEALAGQRPWEPWVPPRCPLPVSCVPQ